MISGDVETDGKVDAQSVPNEVSNDNAANEGAIDLREHMVSILFSRSGKLTHLQKQVMLMCLFKCYFTHLTFIGLHTHCSSNQSGNDKTS